MRRNPNNPPPSPGRPKGAPNKITKTLKEAILAAAEEAGGAGGLQSYLVRQARKKNPTPFMALVGKVLPLQVVGGDGKSEPIRVEIHYVQPKPREDKVEDKPTTINLKIP